MACNLQSRLDMQARSFSTTVMIGMLASCDLDSKLLVAFAPDQRVVGSAGTVRLAPEGNAPIEAVHVRVSVSDLVADASSAELVAPGYTPVHPLAIRGDLATLPFVSLDGRQRGELDFFFPLGIDPTAATFEWAGMRSTLATHVELDDRAATWWFSATPTWSTLRRQDGVITTRLPTTATIVRASEIDRESPSEECSDW
jgi:hypothetical protein